MSDALLVLNAGSSSPKWFVSADEDPPSLLLHGEIGAIGVKPRFAARRNGAIVAEHAWDAPSDHPRAIDFLFAC